MTPARLVVELAQTGRPVSFLARGGSMWPAVPSGSVVEITPCDPAALRAGEIAAYTVEDRLVVHRVVEVAGDVVRFRGDALPSPDGDVPAARVVGRARVVRRRPLRLRWPSLAHLVRALRAARRRLFR